MLELHDCIYCGQPVIVNGKLGQVYSVSCNHDNDIMFYIPNETQAPPVWGGAVVAKATAPVQVVDYAAMWEGDDEEDD